MGLNKFEIANVVKLEPFKRYKYFVKKLADFQEFWTIVDESNNWALSKVDDHTLISFWTAEPFIKSNLEEGWKGYIPKKFKLEDFEKIFVPLIQENGYLINVFPINGRSGFVVNLDELVRDLNEEIDQLLF